MKMATIFTKRFARLVCVLLCLGISHSRVFPQNDIIQTVNGPIESSNLGFALTHEHVMSNFGKAMDITLVYAENKLFGQVIPYLKQLKTLGVDAIFDCTAAYFGRRVDLLKKISDSSDIQIITNTGIYGAANDKYIPNSLMRTMLRLLLNYGSMNSKTVSNKQV